jgi:hypothetical protein
MVGDTVFLIGVGALVWFAVGLKTGWSLEKATQAGEEPSATPSTATLAPERL